MTALERIAVEMGLLVVAAPLLVFALGRGRWDRASVLGRPFTGIVALNGALVVLQAPLIVQAVTRSPTLFALAQLVFLGAASSFWWPILRPEAKGGLSPMSRIGYLFIAGVPPTIPGAVLAFSRHLLYPGVGRAGALGLSPLQDQQLAGLLLFGTAKALLVTLTLVTLWRVLGGEGQPPDDGWDEPGIPAAPPPPPAWFQRLYEDLPPEPAIRPAQPARVGALDQTSGQGYAQREPGSG